MRFTKAAQRAGTRGRPWPRVVGAIALPVLGACGAIGMVVPSPASPPTSLGARSNWVLAGAMPAGHDFPADWGYALYAPLLHTPMADSGQPGMWREGVPRV